MAIMNKYQRETLKKKLAELNKSIQLLQTQGLAVPDVLMNQRNKMESQLNPNKYNAKKVEKDGVVYDSGFEKDYAVLLQKAGIQAEHHRIFELMEPFEIRYKDPAIEPEKIRAITYEADFIIDDYIIIDIKGNNATKTRTFEDKWKMLKNKYRDRYVYILVKNQSEAILSLGTIQRILEKRKENG